MRMDALGSFFGLIVSLLGFALSLYSLATRAVFRTQERRGARHVLNLMLLATTLVVMADNAFFFLMPGRSWR